MTEQTHDFFASKNLQLKLYRGKKLRSKLESGRNLSYLYLYCQLMLYTKPVKGAVKLLSHNLCLNITMRCIWTSSNSVVLMRTEPPVFFFLIERDFFGLELNTPCKDIVPLWKLLELLWLLSLSLCRLLVALPCSPELWWFRRRCCWHLQRPKFRVDWPLSFVLFYSTRWRIRSALFRDLERRTRRVSAWAWWYWAWSCLAWASRQRTFRSRAKWGASILQDRAKWSVAGLQGLKARCLSTHWAVLPSCLLAPPGTGSCGKWACGARGAMDCVACVSRAEVICGVCSILMGCETNIGWGRAYCCWAVNFD